MDILVLFGEVAYISKNETLKGIVDNAKNDGNNVFLFTSEGFLYHNLVGYSKGEYEIFKLPNFKQFDGLIVDFNSIQNDEIRNHLRNKIADSKIPCISFETPIDNACILNYDNTKAFADLVKHLIVDHKYTNIHYLSGPIGNNHCKLRLETFKGVMDDYKLYYSDETIFFGDLNYVTGKKLAEKYFAENIPLPEAIVAANDYMAIGLIEGFKSHGIICPKDIKVVGVDNTIVGAKMKPKLTTIDLNAYESGVTAYKALLKMINKEHINKDILVNAKLHINESCGCSIPHEENSSNTEFIKLSIQVDQNLDLLKNLSINLIDIKNHHEFETNVAPLISNFGIDFFYFCQFGTMESYYKSLEMTAKGLEDDDTVSKDYAWCPIAYEQGSWKSYPAFRKNHLLPPKSKKTNGVYYIIMPVHKNEVTIGYSIMGNLQELLSGRVLQHLVLGLDRAISNIINTDLTNTMLARVNAKWKYDELTNIFNRSGFYDKINSIINENRDEELGLLVIFFDLDGLKLVNDQYGHKAGDEYIKKMAQLLVLNSKAKDVYTRYGGDEFVLVSPCYEDSYLSRFTEIKDAITKRISVSVGYSYKLIEDISNINQLIEDADKMMYEDKQNRKKLNN